MPDELFVKDEEHAKAQEAAKKKVEAKCSKLGASRARPSGSRERIDARQARARRLRRPARAGVLLPLAMWPSSLWFARVSTAQTPARRWDGHRIVSLRLGEQIKVC